MRPIGYTEVDGETDVDWLFLMNGGISAVQIEEWLMPNEPHKEESDR